MDDPMTITKRLLADCNTPSTVEEIEVRMICLQMRTHKYQLLLSSLPSGWCICLAAGAVVLFKHPKKREKKLNRVVPKP
ncbi:hypothetical protein ACOSP7_027642 [Xanthoceras sorbifolium]